MADLRALATDAVIIIDSEIVLLERDHPPFEGQWVLPGGLVEQGETAREACIREVTEEVGLDVEVVAFVGLYDAPNRDERGNVSAAYRCRPVGNSTPTAREEAKQVQLCDPTDLPKMGFDHETIVTDALDDR
jgi:8-oxo-dGTP diphosphatase